MPRSAQMHLGCTKTMLEQELPHAQPVCQPEVCTHLHTSAHAVGHPGSTAQSPYHCCCCALQDGDRIERERRRQQDKYERERLKEELRRQKEMERLRAAQERELKKLEAKKEKEKKVGGCIGGWSLCHKLEGRGCTLCCCWHSSQQQHARTRRRTGRANATMCRLCQRQRICCCSLDPAQGNVLTSLCCVLPCRLRSARSRQRRSARRRRLPRRWRSRRRR